MYKINQKINISVPRKEVNFDRACETANIQALCHFGVDQNGHLTNVEGSDRSRDFVVVKFIEYRCSISMVGQEAVYTFKAWVERGSN